MPSGGEQWRGDETGQPGRSQLSADPLDGGILRGERVAGSRVFYVAMAGLLLLTAVAGFGASYIAPVVGGASIGPAVLHLMPASRSLGASCS